MLARKHPIAPRDDAELSSASGYLSKSVPMCMLSRVSRFRDRLDMHGVLPTTQMSLMQYRSELSGHESETSKAFLVRFFRSIGQISLRRYGGGYTTAGTGTGHSLLSFT